MRAQAAAPCTRFTFLSPSWLHHSWTKHAQLVKTDVKDCETNFKAEDRRVSFPRRPSLTIGQRHHLHLHGAGCVSAHSFRPLRVSLYAACCVFTLPGHPPPPPCRWRNRPHPCRGDAKDAGMEVARSQAQGQKKDGSGTANSEVKLLRLWPDYQWQMIIYSDCSNKYTIMRCLFPEMS